MSDRLAEIREKFAAEWMVQPSPEQSDVAWLLREVERLREALVNAGALKP